MRSPAAYRMIRSGDAMRLPREQLIRDLMSRSLNDAILKVQLNVLPPNNVL